jgi:hypothetical protein
MFSSLPGKVEIGSWCDPALDGDGSNISCPIDDDGPRSD